MGWVTPFGTGPIRRWNPALGSISDEDAEAMLRAVEEGCERVTDAEDTR